MCAPEKITLTETKRRRLFAKRKGLRRGKQRERQASNVSSESLFATSLPLLLLPAGRE